MGDDGAFSTTTAPELISDVQHVPLMSNAPNVERFAPVWTHSVHFVLIRENEKNCDAVVIGAPSETPVVWVPRRRAGIWSSAAARRCALPRSRARLERVAALRVAMSAPKKLTIVLVGQTGNGKSATGNSLLGRDAFVAKRSLSSVTERCEVHVATLDENDAPILPGDTVAPGASISRATTELRVVDTPGTCDSGALLEDNLRHISAFLRGEADAANDPDGDSNGTRARVDALSDSGGTHALVLVLSAAARFTQEEAVAMERLVARLGEGVLRHAVAVFTRGGEVLRDGGDVHELIASAPRVCANSSRAWASLARVPTRVRATLAAASRWWRTFRTTASPGGTRRRRLFSRRFALSSTASPPSAASTRTTRRTRPRRSRRRRRRRTRTRPRPRSPCWIDSSASWRAVRWAGGRRAIREETRWRRRRCKPSRISRRSSPRAGAGLDPAAWNERWNERRAPRLESLWRIFQPRVIDGSGGEQTGDSIRREGNERRRRLRRW